MSTKEEKQQSCSTVQKEAEKEIREKFEKELDVKLVKDFPVQGSKIQLDGFMDGPNPICVEIWAHQGKAKGGQPHKVMNDMCKLLLAEKLLGRKCRKYIVVSDEKAISFLKNSWKRDFAEEFGIKLRVVKIKGAIRKEIEKVQDQQKMVNPLL